MKQFNIVGLCLGIVCNQCVPTFPTTNTRIDQPRVLAVQVEPAEAAPGSMVTLRTLYVDSSGTLSGGSLNWSVCTARKSLVELGPVSRECLENSGEHIVPAGMNVVETSVVLPMDSCRLFGPIPPASQPGEPSGRPVDPDITGGFYLPGILRSAVQEVTTTTLFQARLACGIGTASQQSTIEFNRRYRVNENPAITQLFRITDQSSEEIVITEGRATFQASRNTPVRIRAQWPECPAVDQCGNGICSVNELRTTCAQDCSVPHGCHGAETYVILDRQLDSIVTRRESMRVAWYSSAGTFENERTGVASEESRFASENVWTTPEQTGTVFLWIVLRDDRGGVSWQMIQVEIT